MKCFCIFCLCFGYSYLVAVNVGSTTSTDDYSAALHEIPGSAEVVVTSGSPTDLDIGEKRSLGKVTLKPGEGVVFTWEYTR